MEPRSARDWIPDRDISKTAMGGREKIKNTDPMSSPKEVRPVLAAQKQYAMKASRPNKATRYLFVSLDGLYRLRKKVSSVTSPEPKRHK